MITRLIYPLSLRERISWKIQKFISKPHEKNISIAFNKHIKLDLKKADIGHKSIIFNGFYELGLSKIFTRLGKKGGVLVDVGANYGYFSCLWASMNSQNKVFAFEASPINIVPLKNNIDKNHLAKQIEIFPFALGKESGSLKFSLKNEDQQTGWGGFTIDENVANIDVEVITLDAFAVNNNLRKIDVLKIDTEGADTWVLYGAEKLLKNKAIKHIYYECNMPRMQLLQIQEQEAETFLKKIGYNVNRISETDFYACPKE